MEILSKLAIIVSIPKLTHNFNNFINIVTFNLRKVNNMYEII